MEITKQLWGRHNHTDIYLLKLNNGSVTVSLSNFGAAIAAIDMPGRDNIVSNIVLGYDNLEDYVADTFYMGCVIGRFAGRISRAQFDINGVTYPLSQNDAASNNHLHGGYKGFSKQAFTITAETTTPDSVAVEMCYRSHHLEEGYPGNLDVWVTYKLTQANKLEISYRAISDHDTHINLTNHSYFNLSGIPSQALDSKLFIDADQYIETDADHIPTGAIMPVKKTVYDFTDPQVIKCAFEKLNGQGYNECYVLNNNPNRPCAVLYDETAGRKLVLETDMPALLFYSGDYLDKPFNKNSGICLETQFFPDSPNRPDFPGTLLLAGENWESSTSFTFCWDQ